jgi:hypothetical protein
VLGDDRERCARHMYHPHMKLTCVFIIAEHMIVNSPRLLLHKATRRMGVTAMIPATGRSSHGADTPHMRHGLAGVLHHQDSRAMGVVLGVHMMAQVRTQHTIALDTTRNTIPGRTRTCGGRQGPIMHLVRAPLTPHRIKY